MFIFVFGNLRHVLKSYRNVVPALPSGLPQNSGLHQSRAEILGTANGCSNTHSHQYTIPPPINRTNAGLGLPLDVIKDGVKTYFAYFHAQPYSLLCPNLFKVTEHISPVILNPMLALAIRCSNHAFWEDPKVVRTWIQNLAEESWKELTQIYGAGNTGLTYLQALCLQAQVDFGSKFSSNGGKMFLN